MRTLVVLACITCLGGKPAEPSRAMQPTAVPVHGPAAERAQTSQLVFYLVTPDEQATCPAEILVTDPMGRRAGVDPATLKVIDEIPDSHYDEAGIALPARNPCGHDDDEMEATPRLVIRRAPPGEYRVVVVGKSAGAYTLVIDQYPDDMRQPPRRLQPGGGVIDAGMTEVYVVRIEP